MPRTVGERADALKGIAEVFREHGFEGASLSLISDATGFGKGSLYHFFPGGKEEMAEAVLTDIDRWFEQNMFAPMRDSAQPREAVVAMIANVDAYFRSGERICLVGAFALSDVRDRFAARIADYFVAWRHALSLALRRIGHSAKQADSMAEEAVAGIQGALVASRAFNDTSVFSRVLAGIAARLMTDPD